MKKSNIFKIAALTAVFAVASMFAYAQQTTGEIPAQATQVKVIDNKGTVKYLQSANGITTLTNTTGNLTTTTFQLGGTLLDDTYIDVDGKEFGITGLDFVTSPPTVATEETGTGFAMMVVNNQTGELQKMFFTDLIQSGHKIYTISATPVDYSVSTDTYTFTNLPLPLPLFKNVYVYRNGAKLLAGVDYTIGVDPFTTFIIVANSGTDGFPIYNGDKIEIHFIK